MPDDDLVGDQVLAVLFPVIRKLEGTPQNRLPIPSCLNTYFKSALQDTPTHSQLETVKEPLC
jgi:hypothetical protein